MWFYSPKTISGVTNLTFTDLHFIYAMFTMLVYTSFKDTGHWNSAMAAGNDMNPFEYTNKNFFVLSW